MPDPCNRCGACCWRVRGVTAIWEKMGWLLPNGSCKFYDPWYKRCTIYETRPLICRMRETCPTDTTLEQWYDHMSIICDDAHQLVFGEPREKFDPKTGTWPRCYHRHGVLELQIETTAACNASCHFCPYRKPINDKRRGKMMEDGLYTKIIDEAATIPEISQLVFNGLGEPLTDPKIYDRIAYAKSKCGPQTRLMLHTNGVYLDPVRLNASGLNRLVVSLNAVRPEQHEEIMGIKGQFDKICARIEEAQKLPGWKVMPRFIYSQDRFTEEDMVEARNRWGWGEEDIVTTFETNWIAHNRTMHEWADENQGCLRALTQLYVAYNGDMHMCCMDAFGRIVFGNLNKNTIREIYNSDKYVAFRQAHYEDRALDVPECVGCSRC